MAHDSFQLCRQTLRELNSFETVERRQIPLFPQPHGEMKELQEELLRTRACEYVLGHQICLVTARVLICKCIYKCSLRNGIQEVNLKRMCSPFMRMMVGNRSTGVRQWPLTKCCSSGELGHDCWEEHLQLCSAGEKNSPFRLHFPPGQQPEEALIPSHIWPRACRRPFSAPQPPLHRLRRSG